MNGSRRALVAAVALVSGCSSAQVQPVEEVAASFSGSVEQDPAAACELLGESTREQLVASEQKPCPAASASWSANRPAPSSRFTSTNCRRAPIGSYLRQRGSPESKPVGEAHDTSG